MKILSLFFILLSLSIFVHGQNLFPDKFDDCDINSFCLDCGDTKAHFDSDINQYFNQRVKKENYVGIQGSIIVQVLVDSTGRQCVKSISNVTNIHNISILGIRDIINAMPAWQPAETNKKPINVSLNLNFTFNLDSLMVSYEHFDLSNMGNMSSVGDVVIANKNYRYSPPHGKERFIVYNTKNSIIPWDMTRAICIDKEGIIWLGTDNGVVKIDGDKMTLINSSNSLLKKRFNQTTIMAVTSDIYNNKWFTDGETVYKYDNKNWTTFDSINTPLKATDNIYTDNYGNVWFPTDEGLVRYDGNKWTLMNKNNSIVPLSRILGVFNDSKKRLWVSDYDSSVMIENNAVVDFKTTDNPLKHASITNGYEDKKGNIWLSLYEHDNIFSGLAKYSSTGEWSVYNISNSGIPSNDILDFAIDENSNTIWVSVNELGLAKFDGRIWTIYTPENSNVPSTYIQKIIFDNNGNLWCATFNGLLKVETR